MGKMSRPKWWLLMFACASPLSAVEPHQLIEQLYHTAWTAKDGLTGEVHALAQTADGFLWVGTRDGLLRFDGVSFERYRPNAGSLPARDVVTLFAVPVWSKFSIFMKLKLLPYQAWHSHNLRSTPNNRSNLTVNSPP